MGKKSPLRNRDLLLSAIEGAASKKEILERLGLRPAGGNYRALDKALNELSINAKITFAPTSFRGIRLSDEQIFCENSTYNSGTNIKKRLKEKGFPQECSECHIGSEWNGKPLTLQLEHINGIHSDNRLENLTLLCPNCHSQTQTFAGSNSPRVRRRNENGKIIWGECECGEHIYSKDKNLCKKCDLPSQSKRRKSKIVYPEIEDLITVVKEKGYTKVAEELGVSDNAIRKHIQREGQEPPKFYKTRKDTPVVE